MLRNHFTRYTLVTLLLAVFAGTFTFLYLNSVRSIESKAVQVKLATFKSKESVILATRDITAGSVVNSKDVKAVKIISAYVIPRAVRKASEVIGQVAKVDIYRGEQLAAGRVGSRIEDLPASGTIGKGKLALALPVDEISGVGGGIRSGDYVDIFVTYEDSDESQLMLKSILVRGLSGVYPFGGSSDTEKNKKTTTGFNSAMDSSSRPPAAVILEVNEEQARALTYASDKGKVRLALLPARDNQ